MNDRFIESCHYSLTYQRKPETKGSYYQINGDRNILPCRISLGIFAQRKGSAKDNQKKNEINGTYKKAEEGFYSKLDNKKIHSSIWGKEDYPEFYGYGIIDERSHVFDLLIFYSTNNCLNSFQVHIFRAMGKPEYLNQAFQYLRIYMNKKPQ